MRPTLRDAITGFYWRKKRRCGTAAAGWLAEGLECTASKMQLRSFLVRISVTRGGELWRSCGAGVLARTAYVQWRAQDTTDKLGGWSQVGFRACDSPPFDSIQKKNSQSNHPPRLQVLMLVRLRHPASRSLTGNPAAYFPQTFWLFPLHFISPGLLQLFQNSRRNQYLHHHPTSYFLPLSSSLWHSLTELLGVCADEPPPTLIAPLLWPGCAGVRRRLEPPPRHISGLLILMPRFPRPGGQQILHPFGWWGWHAWHIYAFFAARIDRNERVYVNRRFDPSFKMEMSTPEPIHQHDHHLRRASPPPGPFGCMYKELSSFFIPSNPVSKGEKIKDRKRKPTE